jgi:hypothetical protein
MGHGEASSRKDPSRLLNNPVPREPRHYLQPHSLVFARLVQSEGNQIPIINRRWVDVDFEGEVATVNGRG